MPSFYLIRHYGAISVSGNIDILRISHVLSSVVYSPKDGMQIAIYSGSESECKRFLARLLEGLARLSHANFPVVDMRNFQEDLNHD